MFPTHLLSHCHCPLAFPTFSSDRLQTNRLAAHLFFKCRAKDSYVLESAQQELVCPTVCSNLYLYPLSICSTTAPLPFHFLIYRLDLVPCSLLFFISSSSFSDYFFVTRLLCLSYSSTANYYFPFIYWIRFILLSLWFLPLFLHAELGTLFFSLSL